MTLLAIAGSAAFVVGIIAAVIYLIIHPSWELFGCIGGVLFPIIFTISYFWYFHYLDHEQCK